MVQVEPLFPFIKLNIQNKNIINTTIYLFVQYQILINLKKNQYITFIIYNYANKTYFQLIH